jgi:catechol 2,3-dioxygenase-like lactoylglutathione lyase family enzyme
MLGDHPIVPFLLATDLKASRDFYAQKVGLEIVHEDEQAVTFRCGNGLLAVSASTTGTADEQTQAGWRVDDLAAELAELRSRGVEILEYDTPELKTRTASRTLAMHCTRGSWIRARTRSESIRTSDLTLASGALGRGQEAAGPGDRRRRCWTGFHPALVVWLLAGGCRPISAEAPSAAPDGIGAIAEPGRGRRCRSVRASFVVSAGANRGSAPCGTSSHSSSRR